MTRLPSVKSRLPVETTTQTAEIQESPEPIATVTIDEPEVPSIEFGKFGYEFHIATNIHPRSVRKNITIRLNRRQAEAMRMILVAFEQSFRSPHGRRASEQDWLRCLLDKVADHVEQLEQPNQR